MKNDSERLERQGCNGNLRMMEHTYDWEEERKEGRLGYSFAGNHQRFGLFEDVLGYGYALATTWLLFCFWMVAYSDRDYDCWWIHTPLHSLPFFPSSFHSAWCLSFALCALSLVFWLLLCFLICLLPLLSRLQGYTFLLSLLTLLSCHSFLDYHVSVKQFLLSRCFRFAVVFYFSHIALILLVGT